MEAEPAAIVGSSGELNSVAAKNRTLGLIVLVQSCFIVCKLPGYPGTRVPRFDPGGIGCQCNRTGV